MWFHSYSFLYGQEYNINIWGHTISHVLLFGIRLFSYGGQWILSISCFLIGYRGLNEKQTLRYLGLFLLGILVLIVGQSDQFLQNFSFEWDIYHFLFINLILLYLLHHNKVAGKTIFFIGSLILIIPFWKFDFLFTQNALLKKILIGDFTSTGEGGWALLPWTSLTFIFYGLGRMNQEKKLNWSQTPSRKNLIKFCALAALFSVSIFYFYPTPIGPRYYAYTFQPPLWALIGINGLMITTLRICFIEEWNQKVSSFKWVQLISNFNWNRNLALTYLLHLAFLFCVSWFTSLDVSGINLVAILSFFIAEIISQVFRKLRPIA